MAVRTKSFFEPVLISLANTWTLLYTCPAGRTARFGGVYVSMGGASCSVLLGKGASAGTVGQVWGKAMGSLEAQRAYEEGVLEPGQKLWGYVTLANVTYLSACGSLLLGAPT